MIKYIYIKSSCNYTLRAYSFYLQTILTSLNLNFTVFILPTISKKITLLKSPHVFKKAKEQFELREYKIVVKIKEDKFDHLESIRFALFNRPKSIQLRTKS